LAGPRQVAGLDRCRRNIRAAPCRYTDGFGHRSKPPALCPNLGAEIGAIAAFLLARRLGRPFVERHFGRNVAPGFLGSQNTLTFVVFASRLLPLAGIIPASFLLAHLGSAAMNGDARTATWTALALGGATALSLLFALLRERQTPRKES